jgi:hypothetical protein
MRNHPGEGSMLIALTKLINSRSKRSFFFKNRDSRRLKCSVSSCVKALQRLKRIGMFLYIRPEEMNDVLMTLLTLCILTTEIPGENF